MSDARPSPELPDETATFEFRALKWAGLEDRSKRMARDSGLVVESCVAEPRFHGLREQVTITVTGPPRKVGYYGGGGRRSAQTPAPRPKRDPPRAPPAERPSATLTYEFRGVSANRLRKRAVRVAAERGVAIEELVLGRTPLRLRALLTVTVTGSDRALGEFDFSMKRPRRGWDWEPSGWWWWWR